MTESEFTRLPINVRWLVKIATWIGIIAVVLYIFRISVMGMIMIDTALAAFLLGIFLPMVFLLFPARRKSRGKLPWYDIVLAVLSILGPALVFINAIELTESIWRIRPPLFPMVLSIITWGLVLEAARRAIGLPILLVAGLVSIYPLFASYMPSVFYTHNFSLERVVGFHFLSNQSLYGLPMNVFGKLLVGFMVFGAAMVATGASKFLVDVSQAILGRMRGGPALVAVVASAFMASLSGSSLANVTVSGTVTIPSMKRLGFKPQVAGAIEAVASNGGILTPPVMGATAFIMAAILQIPYAWVCIAAAIPMLIYYIGVFAQVYVHAQRLQIPALKPSEIPSLKKALKEGWFYIGAIFVLVYLLFWIKVEAWAPFYATLFLIACSLIRKETRPNLEVLSNFTDSLAQTLSYLVAALGAVGLIIGSITLTGVALSMSSELILLSGGNLYLLLFLGAIGAFIMGMGMTITPCYIFMAMVFAPSLVQLEIPPMSSHLFFLYWGTLSFITPPVCATVYAAAALAKAPVMQTGLQSMKLAIVIYIIPFAFVLNPALVANGSLPSILISITAAILGALLIAPAMEGYIPRKGRIGIIPRALIFCIAIFMFFMPNLL